MPKIILGMKLYTLEEVAGLVGVTRSSVTRYIKEGRLNATMIGGKKLVTEENLRKFVQNTD